MSNKNGKGQKKTEQLPDRKSLRPINVISTPIIKKSVSVKAKVLKLNATYDLSDEENLSIDKLPRQKTTKAKAATKETKRLLTKKKPEQLLATTKGKPQRADTHGKKTATPTRRKKPTTTTTKSALLAERKMGLIKKKSKAKAGVDYSPSVGTPE